MKLALRQIPTEVWVDVFRFAWIDRWALGERVDRIGNRKFAEYLQFYLHEWGKRTLETIYLNESSSLSDILRTSLPENIKFFKRIAIWHFDSEALAFLRQISPLFISNDVNLCIVQPERLESANVPYDYYGSMSREEDLPNLRTALDHLAPLLHGIHSIAVDQYTVPLVELYFTPKLPQIKVLSIDFEQFRDGVMDEAVIQAGINFSLNWLTMAGSAEPKLLQLKFDIYPEIAQQFSNAVQQQFLSAKSACTFAVRFAGGFEHLADFHLENGIGEQMRGEFKKPWIFQIFRHQPNAGTALEEWVEETVRNLDVEETVGNVGKSSVIEISNRLTIGQIGANAAANEVNDAGQEADRPSTANAHY